ncbi:ribonuclease H-like domain-containing protein [Tanacetum coccineum]
MDLETSQTTTTTKLPILKQGEYDMWRLRIEKYFQVQDYALWDVIENGNSFEPVPQTTTNADGSSTSLIPGHVTTEENYKDAKTLFAAIQTRFGGNEATKKTQKTLLKQMYENFSAPSTESLDSIFNRLQKNYKKITINGSDTVGYDKSKVECFNCHKMGYFARECRGPKNQDSRNRNQDSSRRTINLEETSSKAMVAIDGAGSQIPDKSRKGVGFTSYNVVPPPLTWLFSPLKFDLSYSGLEEFQQPDFEGYGPKPSKSVSEDTSNEVRESPDAPLVKELVSDDKLEKKTIFPTIAKIEFVRPKQQEKPVRKPVKYAEMYRERVVSGNNYTRVNYNYSAKKAHPSAHRNMVPRAVLMKTGLRSLNTARPVNTAHPKTTVYSARPMSHFSKSAQSTVKRPYQIRTTLTNKNFSQKVNTAKGKFYTARPKAVNTARPNSAVVNAVRANQVNAVKASACWVWRPTKLNSASITLKRHNYGHPQKEDQGYVDSGCSRHMTRNMFCLSDFKEFDGGYVTFGGESNEGKLLVKELLKLMCDKKNSVLFTDTGCFVLSPDFKLADESQVLLKVPRKNNMYSVDMKNIVPKECLTCLVAKVTLDESMLWRRRFTWVFFLATKDETSGILKSFIIEIENLVDKKVKIIRCDNGTEFKNRVMSEFCKQKGIKQEFRNRVLVVKPHNKTPYELFRGRTPSLRFMRPFGCHVTILNTLDYLGKFDGKSDEGFFVGYLICTDNAKITRKRSKPDKHEHGSG